MDGRTMEEREQRSGKKGRGWGGCESRDTVTARHRTRYRSLPVYSITFRRRSHCSRTDKSELHPYRLAQYGYAARVLFALQNGKRLPPSCLAPASSLSSPAAQKGGESCTLSCTNLVFFYRFSSVLNTTSGHDFRSSSVLTKGIW